MRKFNVGDKVVFLKSKLAEQHQIVNVEGTVTHFDETDIYYPYRVEYITREGTKHWFPVMASEITLVDDQPEIELRDGYKVIYSDPATIVIFPDGIKGVAKVLPGDKYNKEVGHEIALRKAEMKANLKRNKVLKQEIKKLGNQGL